MSPILKCIHPEGIKQALQKFKCEEFEHVYVSSEHFEVPFFHTKPIGEWEAPKGFPLCCPFHISVFEAMVGRMKKFPNCCEDHKGLAKQKWFNKKDYKELPMKLLNTLSHTEYHILNQIDKEIWYKDITDYIDYCVASFGQLPNGFGSPIGLTIYLVNVRHVLERREFVPKEKGAVLISYIDSFLKAEESDQTDLSLLLSTYSNWLNTFPFELSLFAGLKEKFKKTLPFLKSEPSYNPYLNRSKAKLLTRSELIDSLITKTENLLSEINTLDLYEKGELTEPQNIAIEILTKKRRMELNGLKNRLTDERKQYIEVIKDWYNGEEEFINKLIPLIQAAPIPILVKKEPINIILKEKLTEYGFFELPKIKALSINGREKLISIISCEDLPFKVAMFNYLDFFRHLEKNHFPVKTKLYKAVSQWIGSDKEGRAIKANISTLSSYSSEDKKRYTAHLHKESVIKVYQELK